LSIQMNHRHDLHHSLAQASVPIIGLDNNFSLKIS
jgi:hypothetical protein